jgi:hypothetical protein
MNYEIQATGFKIWAMSFEIWDTEKMNYEQRFEILNPNYAGWWQCSMVPGLENDSMVQNRTIHRLDSPVPADLLWLMNTRYRCCTIGSSAGESRISKFTARRLSFEDFVNSLGKFNLTFVKTQKPFFYFFRCGVHLKWEKNHRQQNSLLIPYVSFEPGFDPLLNLAGEYL